MAVLPRVTHVVGRALRETGQALQVLGTRAADDSSWRDHFSRHRTLMSLFDKAPTRAESTFVAPCASVSGDVTLAEQSSVWYGAVVRGDANKVTVGTGANVQDNVVIMSTASAGTSIGNYVTIGHNAVLTACTVGDVSLIGMGSVIGEGAVVEGGAFVAAGAVVAPGSVVKSGELWGGNPATKLRDLTPKEVSGLQTQADEYVKLAACHVADLKIL